MIGDVFPSKVIRVAGRVGRLPEHPGNSVPAWRAVLSFGTMIPFITFLSDLGKVYFRRIAATSQERFNFQKTGQDTDTLYEPPSGENVDWLKIVGILSQDPRRHDRLKNSDKRLSFNLQERSIFLAKKNFTFGPRTVAPGTVHLYQTSACEILLYRWPESGRHPTDRFLDARLMSRYKPFLMEPNGCYRIEAGTHYVILTHQKTFFSVHVVADTVRIPFPCTDPFVVRPPKPPEVPFRMPPATPFFDQMGANDDSLKPPKKPPFASRRSAFSDYYRIPKIRPFSVRPEVPERPISPIPEEEPVPMAQQPPVSSSDLPQVSSFEELFRWVQEPPPPSFPHAASTSFAVPPPPPTMHASSYVSSFGTPLLQTTMYAPPPTTTMYAPPPTTTTTDKFYIPPICVTPSVPTGPWTLDAAGQKRPPAEEPPGLYHQPKRHCPDPSEFQEIIDYLEDISEDEE